MRLHNYCVNAMLELGDELKKRNGFIEVVPRFGLLAPRVNDHEVPMDQLTTECMFMNCRQSGRVRMKAYPSLRAKLEDDVREKGIVR